MAAFEDGLPGLAHLEDVRASLGVLMFLAASDLCSLRAVDRRHRSSDVEDSAWCRLCEMFLSKSLRYQLTPERVRELAATRRSWRDHYAEAYAEGRRSRLRPEELHTLRWAFNFTPQAGGTGSASMQFVEFRPLSTDTSSGVLLLSGYPPLPYKLIDGVQLDIVNFPPHYVRRLDNFEWEITNANVTFVSCVGDNVQYTERGFLKLTPEDVQAQSGGLLSLEEAAAVLEDEGSELPRHVRFFRLIHSLVRTQLENENRNLAESET